MSCMVDLRHKRTLKCDTRVQTQGTPICIFPCACVRKTDNNNPECGYDGGDVSGHRLDCVNFAEGLSTLYFLTFLSLPWSGSVVFTPSNSNCRVVGARKLHSAIGWQNLFPDGHRDVSTLQTFSILYEATVTRSSLAFLPVSCRCRPSLSAVNVTAKAVCAAIEGTTARTLTRSASWVRNIRKSIVQVEVRFL